MLLRDLKKEDWPEVAEIFQQGINTGNATFESKSPNWKDWNNAHLEDCRIVAVINDSIVGWAALSPVSSRCVYGGVAEVSVYVSNDFKGKHIGTNLLKNLIDASESIGIWTLQAGIFPENKSSIFIHERAGFRTVGVREKIGKMNGIWRDTILLERRSGITGN